jgi:hypothetical protein
MRYAILGFFISVSANAACNIEQRKEQFDLIKTTYLKGCMDSLDIVVDLGLYKSPNNKSSIDVINMLESKCKDKAFLYAVEKGTCDGK